MPTFSSMGMLLPHLLEGENTKVILEFYKDMAGVGWGEGGVYTGAGGVILCKLVSAFQRIRLIFLLLFTEYQMRNINNPKVKVRTKLHCNSQCMT